jgi:hypothetical protein
MSMDEATPPDEADLRQAFAGAHAPASMRRYQTVPHVGGGPRFQALLAVAGVALVGIVAGTYFGIRGITTGHGGAGASPSARSFTTMAFDPDRGQTVLFGGADGTATSLSDTWLWDGSAWSEAKPAHSPAAAGPGSAMAWDPQSHRLILVAAPTCGASVSSGAVCSFAESSAQVWAWNGQDWAELGQRDGPPVPVALATDERGGRILALSSDPSMAPSGGAGGYASAVPATVPANSVCKGGEKCASIACPLGDGTAAGEGALGGLCTRCGVVPQAAGSAPLCICPAIAGDTRCRPCVAGQTVCPGPLPANSAGVTWSFDGSRFSRVTTATQGPSGAGGQLVWSPAIGRLIDVSRTVGPLGAQPQIACRQGSVCPPTTRESAWRWEGDHWAALQAGSGGSPLPLGASLVSDGRRGNVVALDLGVTLTGSGAEGQWSIQRPSASPPARVAPAGAAFDARRGVVVIFGGEAIPSGGGQPGALGDTWSWDGSTWTLRSGSTKPLPAPGAPSLISPGTCLSAVPAPSRGAPGAGLETPPPDQVCIVAPATGAPVPAPNGGAPPSPGSGGGAVPGATITPPTVP